MWRQLLLEVHQISCMVLYICVRPLSDIGVRSAYLTYYKCSNGNVLAGPWEYIRYYCDGRRVISMVSFRHFSFGVEDTPAGLQVTCSCDKDTTLYVAQYNRLVDMDNLFRF